MKTVLLASVVALCFASYGSFSQEQQPAPPAAEAPPSPEEPAALRESPTKASMPQASEVRESPSKASTGRDAASGMPTGKRMHKPMKVYKEVDKATPQLAK